MQPPIKFGADEFIADDEGRDEFRYPNIWARQKTTGPDRLIIGVASDQTKLMADLMSVMPEPFLLLYVLLVSRCNAELGRYETAETVTRRQGEAFLFEFKDFLERDGRHHLWVVSPETSDLLVYDHHNVIYAYGDLPRFEKRLKALGLREQDSIVFPVPHAHYYNEEFDETETEVLSYWKWTRTDLRAGDDE